MPKKFRCVNNSVLGNARKMMNAGIIPKPSWYDAAMAARPFPGALKGGMPPKRIVFKSDWILRKFYKRFPWATQHEVFAVNEEETISPGRQFAMKVERLIEEDNMNDDSAFEQVEKEYVAARVEWLRYRERTLAKAMENDQSIELAMVTGARNDTVGGDPKAEGMWPPYNGEAPGPMWTEAENYPQSEFLTIMQENTMATNELRIWEEKDPKHGKLAFEKAVRDIPMKDIFKVKWGKEDPKKMKEERESILMEILKDRKKMWLRQIRGKKASKNLAELKDERPAIELADDPYDQLFKDPNRQTPVDHKAYMYNDPNNLLWDKTKKQPWGEWEWRPYTVPKPVDYNTGSPSTESNYTPYDADAERDPDGFIPWDADTKFDPELHKLELNDTALAETSKSPLDQPLFDVNISEEELNKLAKDKGYRKKSLFIRLGNSDPRVKGRSFAQNSDEFMADIIGKPPTANDGDDDSKKTKK